MHTNMTVVTGGPTSIMGCQHVLPVASLPLDHQEFPETSCIHIHEYKPQIFKCINAASSTLVARNLLVRQGDKTEPVVVK